MTLRDKGNPERKTENENPVREIKGDGEHDKKR